MTMASRAPDVAYIILETWTLYCDTALSREGDPDRGGFLVGSTFSRDTLHSSSGACKV